MRSRCLFIFLTLVLSGLLTCVANAQVDADADAENVTSPSELPRPGQRDFESLDLVTPPINKNRRSVAPHEVFYAYRNALTLRAGLFTPIKDSEDGSHSLIGAQYFFTTLNRYSFEIGADLIARDSGRLHGAYRWVSRTEEYRPYSKLGLVLVAPAEDRLVSFMKLENYRLLAAAGFEYLLDRTESLRVELEFTGGTHDFEMSLTAGYVWAW